MKAIEKELSQMDERGIFKPAPSQTGRGLKTKMILRVSYDNDYNLKFKARLVICGYSQVKGLDYQDTYAPTPGISIVNMMLHISKVKGMIRSAYDVSGAFLEGKNDFPIYCHMPKDLRLDNTRYLVIRVRRSRRIFTC